MGNIKESLGKLKFYGKSFNDLTPRETELLLNDLSLVSVIESIKRGVEGVGSLIGEGLVRRHEILTDILGLHGMSDRLVSEICETGNHSFQKFVDNCRELNDSGYMDFLNELLEGSNEVYETVMLQDTNTVFQIPMN